MIGAIIGDIVGSVYEQQNVKTKDFPLFPDESKFTDDTVMTLAVADAILHGRRFDDNFRRFFEWYPKAGYGHMFRAWALDPSMEPYNSFGNGSGMRAAPIGWAYDDEDIVYTMAGESAAVTHNHPDGIKGARAIALGTFLARTGEFKDEILRIVQAHTEYDLDFTLDEIRDEYFFDATCPGSVPHALVAFREGEDFEDVLRGAVSIGGDSDTIACMACAIAGAFYKIPPDIERQARSYLDQRLAGILDLFEARFMASS